MLASDFHGDDKDSDLFYVQTFTITHNTSFRNLKKAACDFWGLIEDKFDIFIRDHNGNLHKEKRYFNNVLKYFEKKIEDGGQHQNKHALEEDHQTATVYLGRKQANDEAR